MEFDLLRRDRKIIPMVEAECQELQDRLHQDVQFLLSQQMPRGPLDFSDNSFFGIMDYSLVLGLVSDDTPGGLFRIKVRDEIMDLTREVAAHDEWRVESVQKTAIIGMVDVLQFWTPAKRIANGFKRAVGMNDEVIDTVQPDQYGHRFLKFMRELFTRCSWMRSLSRMAGGDWLSVLLIHIDQLPDAQRRRAQALYQWAESEHWAKHSRDQRRNDGAHHEYPGIRERCKRPSFLGDTAPTETLSSFLHGKELLGNATASHDQRPLLDVSSFLEEQDLCQSLMEFVDLGMPEVEEPEEPYTESTNGKEDDLSCRPRQPSLDEFLELQVLDIESPTASLQNDKEDDCSTELKHTKQQITLRHTGQGERF